MAQFDVYQNPSSRTGKDMPLLVDIQSSLLDQLDTRIVIPLIRPSALAGERIDYLYPEVFYGEETLSLLTTQISAINKSRLEQAVGSLRDQRDSILRALDFVISGY